MFTHSGTGPLESVRWRLTGRPGGLPRGAFHLPVCASLFSPSYMTALLDCTSSWLSNQLLSQAGNGQCFIAASQSASTWVRLGRWHPWANGEGVRGICIVRHQRHGRHIRAHQWDIWRHLLMKSAGHSVAHPKKCKMCTYPPQPAPACTVPYTLAACVADSRQVMFLTGQDHDLSVKRAFPATYATSMTHAWQPCKA